VDKHVYVNVFGALVGGGTKQHFNGLCLGLWGDLTPVDKHVYVNVFGALVGGGD